MNRSKLERRTVQAEKLRTYWRTARMVDRMVRGTMPGMLAEIADPSLFAHIGSDRHFEFSGGQRVGDVFGTDHST